MNGMFSLEVNNCSHQSRTLSLHLLQPLKLKLGYTINKRIEVVSSTCEKLVNQYFCCFSVQEINDCLIINCKAEMQRLAQFFDMVINCPKFIIIII